MPAGALRRAYSRTSRGQRVATVLALFTLAANGRILYGVGAAQRAPVPGFQRHIASPLPSAGAGGLAQAASTAAPAPGGTGSSSVVSAPLTPRPSAPGALRTPPPLAGPSFPALGVYTYRVTATKELKDNGGDSQPGTESATGFGSRDYPGEMTVDVNRRAHGSPDPPLKASEVFFDLDFGQYQNPGDSHYETEVISFDPSGLLFTFEYGSISFHGFARTSAGFYCPPMLQIPLPLRTGAQITGKSTAYSSSGCTGSSTRTEDWTVTVEGQQTLQILGQPVSTWKVLVHRVSEPGASEEVQPRDRLYWFDPVRRVPVQWEEIFHGQQNFGVTFTYDSQYRATLVGFQPAS